jgi:hypothetical protein
MWEKVVPVSHDPRNKLKMVENSSKLLSRGEVCVSSLGSGQAP